MSSARNTKDGYGWVARYLHWGIGLAVIAMFALGLWMRSLSYYDPWYQTGPYIHRSVGIILFVLLAARLAWKLFNVEPADDHLKSSERLISKVVHWTFYGLLFTMMIAGYLITTADGRSIPVFNWFEVPSVYQQTGIEAIAGLIHEYMAYAIMGLAALHAGAALKHHYIDKDTTLTRMLKGAPKQTEREG